MMIQRSTVPDAMRPIAAAAALACLLGWATTARALPPSPPNDTIATAEPITTLPALFFGTTVLATDDVSNSGGELPAIDAYMDGPDVFYRFEPTVTATYRIQLAPWQRAPLRSSDRRFTIYVMEDLGGGSYAFVDGVRASSTGQPVTLDAALIGGIKYLIVVDHDSSTHDNFDFTLIVDELVLTNPDNCVSAIALPSTLPVTVLNNIDGAANDFAFVQSTERCAVVDSTQTDGVDHVYSFTPAADGDYAIEVIAKGFNAIVYVDDSCDPFFFDSCQGASDSSSSGGGKHELVVVSLLGGVPYYIYIDENGTNNAGEYAIIIDDAANYEITEVEPNDTPATATPVLPPLAGGQLLGVADKDYWSVTGQTGDRVYAYVNNGGSSNSTIDTELWMYAADGTTLIEYDDDDADGIDSPIEDLRYIYSTSASVIAGAKFTSDADHFLYVNDVDSTDTRTVHRYRFHVGIEPADRAPQPEIEPNDDLATATVSGKNFFSGVVDVSSDLDYFAFDAEVGDHVFIAFDGDPERDSAGTSSANTDPLAFHGKLVIYDPDLDVLISDVSDSNSADTAGGPDYPAQACYFVARTAGRYYIEVGPQSSSSQVGPTETYELAVFLNGEPPELAEINEPEIALTPDYVNDIIAGTASDNEAGDTGICSLELVQNNNLQLVGTFTPGAPVVEFTIELVDTNFSGSAVLIVADCAGNTTLVPVAIDISAPDCLGSNYSNRNPSYMGPPLHIENNDLAGNTNGIIEIAEPGLITRITVTVNAIDTLDPGDMDLYLVSPSGTSVELVTDRMSSLGVDIRDARFTDDATDLIPLLGSASPYTGDWLPEDPDGLAQLIGEQAQGVWTLHAIDDSSSEDFGASLVAWSLDIDATFPGPETFAGTAQDLGDGGGIQSIVLTSGTNVQLNLPGDFAPGDQVVDYTVTLIDPSIDGTATITVTDLQENTCQSVITLNGLADHTAPMNSGDATTDLTFGAEVQASVPNNDPVGVTSTITLPDSFVVGEVEVALYVDTTEQGQSAARLMHGGETAVLVNRISMEERDGIGNTKNSYDIYFDDDAPADSDIHLEPAISSIASLGERQPDGRGEFFGNAVATDYRDNMLFALGGLDAVGDWDMQVIDQRDPGTRTTIFRRWAMTLKSPCGPEYYVGTAKDVAPGTGIQSIALAPGATNLMVIASFTPGDAVVDYRVELVNQNDAGAGDLEITDLVGNTTIVPISLAPASTDVSFPAMTGALNTTTFQFEGTATDDLAGDTGISTIGLAPYGDNLEVVSVTPAGGGNVDFVVGLVDPLANGRGYVRAIDGCGHRSYLLIEIDAQAPDCTGDIGRNKRYFSGPTFAAIPDNNPAGVTSNIVVTDTGVIQDVDLTFNITHPSDSDIDMTLISPLFIGLFSDRGSTGNDFIDVTLDDEAAAVLPSSSADAPFTGSWQLEDGLLSTLDGTGAAGTYTLQVVDDSGTYGTGTLDHWSVLIASDGFPNRYDGRAEDSRPYDSGICSVELAAGATNLALTVDPAFAPGDKIVRYSVDLIAPYQDGAGTVEVTDCDGNACAVLIELTSQCELADLDGDLDIDADDYQIFRASFGRTVGDPQFNPAADFNGDGAVGLVDFQTWLACYRDFVGDPLAAPPVNLNGIRLAPRPDLRPDNLSQPAPISPGNMGRPTSER